MLSKFISATVQGLEAMPITVEVDAYESGNVPRFTIVGLPDNAVKESQERIGAAIRNLHYKPGLKSVVVNLSPADVKKEGSGLDLPIALGLLRSYGFLDCDNPTEFMFVGELTLDGSILPVKGALPIAIKAREMGFKALFIPKENEREAAVVNKLDVYGVEKIDEVLAYLTQYHRMKDDPTFDPLLLPLQPTIVNAREEFYASQYTFTCDFEEVKGQQNVKRAFEIAAAGGHNIILIGNPGCGKSMMAKRLPSILPPLTLAESLETTQIHSVAGKLHKEVSLISQRPFRSPHHTSSEIALIGGGQPFSPGEISLSHNGVLFLDEFPEFSKHVLETLRQPLEDHIVQVSRAKYSYTLPCSFMLVASMNPCPCGYLHHPTHACTCSPAQVLRYINKISGPLLDRIDLQVECESLSVDELTKAPKGEPSAAIRERVIKARQIQTERYKDCKGIYCNAQMTSSLMQQYATLDQECTDVLQVAMKRLNLSARAYDRIIKVSRTIADLADSENIRFEHIAEAVGYRNMDREYWYEK